jgi:long-chain acyl-CoA synthetase
MGKYNLNWEDFTGNLLQYGVRYSFFHRSERTVHEQILFRLQSETKPVTYHEIVNGKLVTYETKKVKEEILSAVAAMKNMGVQKGDTVAIITPNTLRYLIVDVATGLLGAILSPIYLTTPISEIKKILTETKAKIFFVGSNKLLEQITYAQITIPIVSLLKQPFDLQKSNQAVPWSEFLSNGGNAKAPAMAPVAFDDLATIRFTYGSTGDSKGACLEQGNLRYLGEAIATNFNWKARNSAIRYLSFLPLNHVAEGIGAAYSFYYVPAKLDFYYLEEYKSLQKALRMAKPTIFFTIPRFYDKLWASILANPMGKRYVKNKRGLKKSVLKRAVRKSLLDKTGLNECVEFYTGSACMSEILVDNFKELGIEIQNAYGLSEAPIVAMNRPGGRSDAVGTPLVGTHIRIDDDGEVLIKGPQVMRGYLNVEKGRQPFRDGWLATGDLGELTEDGYLKITGRKKHLIVTAYGKKIPVDKIEASLRTIDSVKDALFVGENQPYCSAILWVDRNTPYDKSKMLRAIEEINKGLETPAQIKKIEILEDDYSKVDEGLKTKRQVLSQKAEKAINILYSTKTEPS